MPKPNNPKRHFNNGQPEVPCDGFCVNGTGFISRFFINKFGSDQISIIVHGLDYKRSMQCLPYCRCNGRKHWKKKGVVSIDKEWEKLKKQKKF